MNRRDFTAKYQGDLPARLTVEHVARQFDCTLEGVYVLTRRRLLKPLGHPAPNGTKYYARAYILRLCEDEAWLARATDALVDYKWLKNHGEARKESSE